MEAPEKIYLIRNFPRTTSLNTTNDYHGKYLQEWYESREKEADIEYTRADAFIEKACKWLKFNYAEFTDNTRLGIKIDELIKDFKQAMEDKE